MKGKGGRGREGGREGGRGGKERGRKRERGREGGQKRESEEVQNYLSHVYR